MDEVERDQIVLCYCLHPKTKWKQENPKSLINTKAL